MDKKIIGCALGVTILLSSTHSDAFDLEKWYSDYMNEEYIKLTKFNELYEIAEKYNVSLDKIEEMEFKVTAYSSLPIENGGYTVTCTGAPLEGNIIANNTIPLGTTVILDGTEYKVADRGSSRFNKRNRIDLLVSRLPGENDYNYSKRVSNFGVQYIKGYIIHE